MANNAVMRGRPIQICDRERFRSAIRIEFVRLATRDYDKVARAHVEFSLLIKRERRRAMADVMEQRVRALREGQVPGMAELEMEQQGPPQAHAVEYFGEDVHNSDDKVPDDRTQHADDQALPFEVPSY